MAKLIRAVAWRRLERPFTRKSKYRAKSFIKATPNVKIVKFVMGDVNKDYDYRVLLRSCEDIQIRHNAFEASRKSAIRYLEKSCGKGNFMFRILVYPHHALRNNPLASGAGADRMSTGMSRSYGKVVGLAAQIHVEQAIIEMRVKKNHLAVAKAAMNRAKNKFPGKQRIEIIDLKAPAKKVVKKTTEDSKAAPEQKKKVTPAPAKDVEVPAAKEVAKKVETEVVAKADVPAM
ncbi:MAG: 50S ribosomal protein L16 [Candidatus Woesearchaeota archaeon]|nr:MAG: 50S ribosomal protein L16 [Candidatus Woesearchaeota archaeon]